VRHLGGRLAVRIDATEVDVGAADGSAPEVVAAVGESLRISWQGQGEAPTVDLLTQIGRVLDVACYEQETERRRHRERVGQLFSLVADNLADVAAVLPHLEAAGLGGGALTVSAWPAGTGQLLETAMPAALVAEAPHTAFAVTRGTAEVEDAARRLALACGHGSAVSLSHLARGIAEARACLELARRRGRLVGPLELTSLDGLLEQQPPGRLDPFVAQLVRPLVEHDLRHRGQLLDTLRSFVRTEGSLQQTARVHYLHVNTVRHRLGRVQALTGRDPLAFDDRVALAIALWAFDRRTWTR
jgi:hypothetical protein